MEDVIPMSLDELSEPIPEKKAATFLRKSSTTMWRLRKEGLISFRRMGRIYYLREDLREYLESVKIGRR